MSSISIANLLETARHYFEAQQLEQAQAVLKSVLAQQDQHAEALNLLALIRLKQKNYLEAKNLFQKAIDNFPANPLYYFGLSKAAFALEEYSLAKTSIEKAIKTDKNNVHFLFQQGKIYKQTEKYKQAEKAFNQVIKLNPLHKSAFNNLGNVLQSLGKYPESKKCFEKVIEIDPSLAQPWFNLGHLAALKNDFETAKNHYETAIRVDPEYSPAYIQLSVILREQSDYQAALNLLSHLLNKNELFEEGIFHLASTYGAMGDHRRAINSYRHLLKTNPDYTDAWMPYGSMLQHVRRDFNGAEIWFQKALDDQPRNTGILTAMGHLKQEQKDLTTAKTHYDKALEINPLHHDAFVKLIQIKTEACDWQNHEEDFSKLNRILNDYVENKPGMDFFIPPHALNMLPINPRFQKPVAKKYAKNIARNVAGVKELRNYEFERTEKTKLTIAYMSADFRLHVVGQLIYDMFRHHNRDKFTIHAISLLNIEDDYQARIKQGVDVFHDASTMSQEEIADLVYDNKIDILIDLNGYTTHCKTEVLAMEPAPVQAHYLGYPASMGADYVPYIFADKSLLPPELAKSYTETPVYLPSFFVSSPEQVSDKQWTKADFDIPEDHFVFCCFNASYKIDPTVFHAWMRIMHRVEKSVLWLRGKAEDLHIQNILEEARRYGLDTSRIILAKHLDNAEYLARYRVIDLFLDTLHYTAGSTGISCQWTGCPILTVSGKTNSSRMSTSICQSVGLTETICVSLEEYEEKAVHFASNPAELQSIRERLVKNQGINPIFDTAKFVAHMEKAFQEMWQQYILDERTTIHISP